MAIPIRLGSAAGTTLIFEKGSKINTTESGVQSCTINAVYGDGQNIFSKIPVAGTPYNEVFGNNYLPSDFKVDVTDGGYSIEYIEGKAARVSISFKRPDPTQPPGPNGQRNRKVSVDTSLTYTNLFSASVLGLSGISGVGAAPDERTSRFGFPQPVVTVTYNTDTRPPLPGGSGLLIQPSDPRALDFPEASDMLVPIEVPVYIGFSAAYKDNSGEFITDGPLTDDFLYRFDLVFSPNPLGWKLSRLASEPHADESFFDVTESWQNYYFNSAARFVSKNPL